MHHASSGTKFRPASVDITLLVLYTWKEASKKNYKPYNKLWLFKIGSSDGSREIIKYAQTISFLSTFFKEDMPIFWLRYAGRYGHFKILQFYVYSTNICTKKEEYMSGTGSVIQGRISDVVVNFPYPAAIENQISYWPYTCI